MDGNRFRRQGGLQWQSPPSNPLMPLQILDNRITQWTDPLLPKLGLILTVFFHRTQINWILNATENQ